MLLMLLLVPAVLAVCPSGSIYNSQFNRCYTYVNQAQAFLLAEQTCISQGGHLVSIQNGFENNLVAENAASIFGNSQQYWIGANQLMYGNWSWTDNSAFKYANWQGGAPNTTSGCAYSNTATVTWTADSCSLAKKFVCVVPGETTPPTPTPCPTPGPHGGYCASGWTYFDQTDSCYKTLRQDNFDNAENTCVTAGGHLTSIHSDAENTFVADLAGSGMTVDWDQMTWIGMRKVNGVWINVDGTPVNYYKWAPGEPDDSKGIENCVQILSDELSGKGHSNYHYGWNDISCTDTMRAFVCKKAALHN